MTIIRLPSRSMTSSAAVPEMRVATSNGAGAAAPDPAVVLMVSTIFQGSAEDIRMGRGFGRPVTTGLRMARISSVVNGRGSKLLCAAMSSEPSAVRSAIWFRGSRSWMNDLSAMARADTGSASFSACMEEE
jgi:hypothetical protein